MNIAMLSRILLATVLLGLSLQPAGAEVRSGHRWTHEASYGGAARWIKARQNSTSHFLRHLLKHKQELGLTEEQVTQLKSIQLDLDRTRIRTEAEILIAERELGALVEDDQADLPTIERKSQQRETLAAGLRMVAIKAK